MIVERKPVVFCDMCERTLKQTEKFCRMRLYKNCSVWSDVEVIQNGQYPAEDDTYDLCEDCLKLLDKRLFKLKMAIIRRRKNEEARTQEQE